MRINANRSTIYCERSLRRNAFDVFLLDRDPTTGKQFQALPLVFDELPADMACAAPAMTLDGTTAQHLMDELWRCGIRPSEGQGSAGALAATQDHLKDMQRLGFTLLEQLGRPKE